MRHCLRRLAVLATLGSLNMPALEISTGFLIGPRHDARAFYFREQPGGVWQKSYAGREYRRQAQGRLLGITVHSFAAPPDRLRSNGLSFVRVMLQTAKTNAFTPNGKLKDVDKERLASFLNEASRRGAAVELVLFHPGQDENFETPEAIDEAVRHVTDWLIDSDQRHVILNPGGDWSAAGWDFDNYVPTHLAQFAQLIRDRFQARHTDYALPVALTAGIRLSESSALVQEADILVLTGEGLATDPRRIERPLLVLSSSASACAQSFERFSGCIVETGAGSDAASGLAEMVRVR